jgi:hypothetical protein
MKAIVARNWTLVRGKGGRASISYSENLVAAHQRHDWPASITSSGHHGPHFRAA